MSAAAPRTDRSARVDLLLPDTWWAVDLRSPLHRSRSITALVDRQVGRADRKAGLRAEIRAQVSRTATDAVAAGAFLLAFSLMQWRDVPLPASVAGYRLPRTRELEALRAELALQDQAVDERDRCSLDLVVEPRGALLRRVWNGRGPDELEARDVTMLRADYWLDLPGAADLLLFSFCTPMTPAAEVMVDLFDVIVSTVEIPTDRIPTDCIPTDHDVSHDRRGLTT